MTLARRHLHPLQTLRPLAVLLLTLVTALTATVEAAPTARAATPAATPRATAAPPRTLAVKGIFDSPGQYVFCHDRTPGMVDYAVGDPPRATWKQWVQTFSRCAAKRTRIYIRYNHEIDGFWMPYSWKTPARFRKDFCDFKAYLKANLRPTLARRTVFALGLNLGPHRGTSGDWWTPCADLVAVSLYEQTWMNWNQFLRSDIGPEHWLRFARTHRCGAARDRPTRAQVARLAPCRLALGEWGAYTPQWMRLMRSWMDRRRVVYGAYLYHPGVRPWIDPRRVR